MAIKLADTARPNNYVDAEHLGTFPVAYAEDVWFTDGTRLSEKTFDGQSIQKEELPLASADELGNIYQYVGETGTYTKGYFYECVSDGKPSPTYSWKAVIKNASSVFIGTSSEWESETSKTDYQVAILTDQPTVNAVDSTDGSTTVVGEPNKRWVGTQAEWDNLTAAEKAEYEIVCFNDDNEESGKDIYSTTETKTNKVWIDGKPIYRKVFTDVSFPEEEDIVQADRRTIKRYTSVFSANYISAIVSASFVAINRTHGNEYSLPRTWESVEPDTEESMIVSINANIISEGEEFGYSLEIGSNRTSWNNTNYKVRAIIEYTKVGD